MRCWEALPRASPQLSRGFTTYQHCPNIVIIYACRGTCERALHIMAFLLWNSLKDVANRWDLKSLQDGSFQMFKMLNVWCHFHLKFHEARFMFQEYLKAPSTNPRCFILIILFSFSKYLQRGLDSFWGWHLVRLAFYWFQSHLPSSPSCCPLLKRPWFFFFYCQDFSGSWMSHGSNLSLLHLRWGEGVHAPLTELIEAIW